VLQQLQSSFVLVSERIKRKEAEAILQHAKMVDAARLQAQNAFDEGGLLASLANNSVLESYKAEAAFKVGLMVMCCALNRW
jgi:predicted ABC-class ATPase